MWHAGSQIICGTGSADENGRDYLVREVTQERPLLTLPVWLRLFILLVAFGVHRASAQSQWGVVFYTHFSADAPISDMPWNTITHVNHLGCEPVSSGALSCEANFATRATALISAAHANKRKVLLSVGQLDGGADFNGAITNDQSTLIANIMSQVTTYGYDGVDIDWETNWNGSLAASFFSALRTSLGTLLLTADALPGAPFWNDYGSTHNLHTYLDRINVMTYDLTGSFWSVEWLNSPLYRKAGDVPWSADYIIKTGYVGDGVPIGKINIAIPFYGYAITGGGTTNLPRATWVSGNPPTWTQMTYTKIVANYSVSNANWDSDALVPWVSITGGWLTYDNAQSIAYKIRYMKANGLGGWFAWNFETDYIAGGNPTHPLLAAINDALSLVPPTDLHVTLVK